MRLKKKSIAATSGLEFLKFNFLALEEFKIVYEVLWAGGDILPTLRSRSHRHNARSFSYRYSSVLVQISTAKIHNATPRI